MLSAVDSTTFVCVIMLSAVDSITCVCVIMLSAVDSITFVCVIMLSPAKLHGVLDEMDEMCNTTGMTCFVFDHA